MNNSTNASLEYSCVESSFRFKLTRDGPYRVVLLLIIVAGFIGNVATVAVISCWRKLHTPTFTMLACLAVSDAYSLLTFMLDYLTNLHNLIFCIYKYSLRNMVYYEIFSGIYYTLYILGRLNAGMQLSELVCIRFVAIVYPIKFKTRCTCKSVIVISVGVSVMVLILATVSRIVARVKSLASCDISMATLVVNFFVPSSILTVLHFLKLRALRRSPASNNNSSLKMNVVICIVMTIYISSSVSDMIIEIILCYTHSFNEMDHFEKIRSISFVINCASNPFIYVFSSPPFIQMFQKMWHQLRQRFQIRNNENTPDIEMNTIQIHVVNNHDNIENGKQHV